MTINQLIEGRRRKKGLKKSNTSVLNEASFRSGICIRAYVTTSKKLNSALRKVVKAKLYNGTEVMAYILREGYNLQEHSAVIVRNVRVKDLPEDRCQLVGDLLDLKCIGSRKNTRSKYETNLTTSSKNWEC
ncbi:30S ribosomal protein S12 [Candidatus Hodgkinia cicadicola]|nr:30S ribosomal protein S12 [Candidatus Hodgkinia cicadicola]